MQRPAAPHIGLNASFVPTDALNGELAFVSQSDALVAVILDWARARAIGFSQVVSLGSQADVDLGDMLDYLGSDSRTRAIVVYRSHRVAAQIHVGGARRSTQQAGDRRQVRAFAPRPAGGSLAHRRTGRL